MTGIHLSGEQINNQINFKILDMIFKADMNS